MWPSLRKRALKALDNAIITKKTIAIARVFTRTDSLAVSARAASGLSCSSSASKEMDIKIRAQMGKESFSIEKDSDESKPMQLKRRTLSAQMRRHRHEKNYEEVHETYAVLRENHRFPGRGAFNVLVHCYADMGDHEAVLEVVREMVRDKVVPDVTTHHGVILAFCRDGRVSEAFEWLQMHCKGVNDDDYYDRDGKSGFASFKQPGEALALSEIFDEQDADVDLDLEEKKDGDDTNTSTNNSNGRRKTTMSQPAPQTSLPVKLFTTVLRYAAIHASREIFQATEVLMFQMNQPNLTPGADVLESKLRLVGSCANGTSREIEEVWQMFKNEHKSMWAHSERVSAHCKIANRTFEKHGGRETAASDRSVKMAEAALEDLLWRLGKRVYVGTVPSLNFSKKYNVKYRTGWSGARGQAAAQFLKRRDESKSSQRRNNNQDGNSPWKSWRKEAALARHSAAASMGRNNDDDENNNYEKNMDEDVLVELAFQYAIRAHEKEVRAACNAVSAMFANRGDVKRAKEAFQMMTANEVRPDVYSFTALMRAELNAFLSPPQIEHADRSDNNAEEEREEEEEEHEQSLEDDDEEIKSAFIKEEINKKEDEDEMEDRLDETFARVEALRERMLDAGIVPDAASFVTELVLAGKFYASMMERDGGSNRLVQDRRRRVSNILMRMQSLQVQLDSMTFNALIGALARNNDLESAFKTYTSMDSSNISPDAVTFLELFLACERRGREIYDVSAYLPHPTHGEKREEMLQTALRDMNDDGDPLLIEVRDFLDKAEKEMEAKEVLHTSESLTALVRARGKLRQPHEIVKLFEAYKNDKDISDDRFFASCVQSLSIIDPNEALRLFDEVYENNNNNTSEKTKIAPNVYALNACVQACAELRQISEARQRVSRFVKNNPGTPISSETLDCLFMCAAASGAFATQAPKIAKEIVTQLGVQPSKKIFHKLYEGVGLAHENDRNVSMTLARELFGDAHSKKYEDDRRNRRSNNNDNDGTGKHSSSNNRNGEAEEFFDDDDLFDDDDDF